MPKKINPKIKERIKELILSRSYAFDENKISARKMKVSYERISQIVYEETHEDVSDRTIATIAQEMSVQPVKRGGLRDGAGRPQGSKGNKKREYHLHQLTITNNELLSYAGSAFDKQNPVWDSVNGAWAKLEHYKVKDKDHSPRLRGFTVQPIADKYMNFSIAAASMK